MNPTGSGKYLLPDALHRFWKKVLVADEVACWEWQGAKHSFGYGVFCMNKRRESSHRVAFMDCVGPIPEGHVVRHKCDNPPCCNPSHLETGTQRDNLEDATKRGRLNRRSHYTKKWLSLMKPK